MVVEKKKNNNFPESSQADLKLYSTNGEKTTTDKRDSDKEREREREGERERERER